MPPTARERRFTRFGPKMTSHAIKMMITRITDINSSTGTSLPKTLTRGNSSAVDGRGPFHRPEPGRYAGRRPARR